MFVLLLFPGVEESNVNVGCPSWRVRSKLHAPGPWWQSNEQYTAGLFLCTHARLGVKHGPGSWLLVARSSRRAGKKRRCRPDAIVLVRSNEVLCVSSIACALSVGYIASPSWPMHLLYLKFMPHALPPCFVHMHASDAQVLDCSDVVIQVLDARNVPGTRCPHLENHLKKNASHKHLIFVINKVHGVVWSGATCVGVTGGRVLEGIAPLC